RVLKPPGGASSDIFGRPDEVDQSPRKIRSNHHLKSSVFGTHSTPEPPATSRSKPGNDTHNRLFGPLENRPQSASLNRMKSNIPVGVVGAGSELGQSSSSTSSKSVPIENGQQEMLSTPKGEIHSAVCTQPLRNFRGYLGRIVALLWQDAADCFTGHRNHFLPNGMTSKYLRIHYHLEKQA
ncbi:hypothetical protein B7P43_G06108, partial [Cryptotermes secundus]